MVDLWGASGSTGGELLVKWRDGPASAAAVAGNTRLGATVKRDFNAVGWQLVELPSGLALADGLQAYRKMDGVLLVEPNRASPLALPPAPGPAAPVVQGDGLSRTARLHGPALAGVTPDDPLLPQQWHLRKIGATNAWATTTGSAEVVVAIIDTGVDYTHPDLAANMWRNPGETGLDAAGNDKGTNGVDDDENGYADDVHGANLIERTGDPMDTGFWETPVRPKSEAIYHGTFIAGLVGAVGDNAIGGAGLNWSVRLMAIRFIGGDLADPRSFQFTDSIAVAAWDYAVMMKRRGVNLRVINLSAGGYRPSVPMADVLQTAGNEGILTVCGAGNNAANNDLWSPRPASYNIPSVLSAAASTESDALADFASYGATTVDLAAPGINMSSTWKSPGYDSGRSGASYASPLVAGTAALLLARDPGLSVDQLKAALLGSADQPAGLRGKLVSHGRLNVARALEYLDLADPPAIVVFAAPGGQRTLPDEPLRLTFSRPMNRASVEAALAITPAVVGTFEWSADHRNLVVRHDVPFDTTTAYTVRLGGSAEDESGGTLDGDFDRVREGSPADDFVWTFRFQIPNDDFADAQVLVGESGSVAGNNRYAFVEWDEPRWFATPTGAYGSSLWYRWAAPTDGWFTFDLGPGSSFDSVLVVSTGDRLDQLEGIAWNDQYGNRTSSRLSFAATAGIAYSIVVANKSETDLGATGSFRLSWYPTPSPGFSGSQFSPVSGVAGAKVTLSGTNFTGATAVLFGNGSAAFANALTNNLDLRLTATVPPDATSGPITVVTPHGSVTSSATFQVLPPPLTVRSTPEGRVEISWPATSDAFVLESASELAGPNWEAVSALVLRADGQSRVLVRRTEAARFFRLKAQ